MNLTTDKACFNIDLRQGCRIIAIAFLILTAISAIISPNYFTSSSTLIGFVFYIIANVSLLFASQLENQWLVLPWLVMAIFYFVGWPIAVLGVIFHFGDYRRTANFDNVFLIILEYIISLVLFCFIARIVYSYWHHLRNRGSNPHHSVVV